MALTSPGVQVSVIDESFYTPAEPGTVPLVFVASASNKKNAAATGTAQGTLKANAGKPYLLTSQRDLADTFGDPTFQIDANNNPIHAGELNEYGLQAAYSLLGVSNRAWVVRADIDLDELTPTATAPSANPLAGTYWFDTRNSNFGIQQWNAAAVTTKGGQTFTTKTPIVIDTTDGVVNYAGADYTPKASTGAIGDYAVVAVTTLNRTWYKNALGTWVEVGSDAWAASWPTIKSTIANPTLSSPAADITVNGTAISVGANTITDVAASITTFLAAVGITAFGGFLGGLLGLGGGIIFVPFLFFIFNSYDLHTEYLMQSAVSTSLACVVISSLSAAIKHNKNKLINWLLFEKMLPGLILGSVIGVILITILTSDIIKIYYGILLLIIAIYLINQKEKKNLNKNSKHQYINIFSLFTGTISTMLGIGGGTLTTPYFKFYGESMKGSIATAAACGVPIALLGILITLFLKEVFGVFENTVLDFIDFYAFFLVSTTTLVFSYLGAGLTYKTNTLLLKKIFCITLFLVGITILFY